jgi:DnaK suppressor protein
MPTKKAAKKKVAAKKATPAKKATVKKASAVKKAPAKKAPVKKAAAKTVRKAAPAPMKKKPAPAPAKKKKAPAPVKKGPAKKKAPVTKAPVKTLKKVTAAPARKPPPQPTKQAAPAKRTKAPVLDKFILEQVALLEEERQVYTEQAESLKAEADQLAQEMEPGDIQFDEESGEGATMNIDRERDLALSAQARAAVEEIDHAMAKIRMGTYGTCENCGRPIPKARLKALPYARLCVACKSGGLSRR